MINLEVNNLFLYYVDFKLCLATLKCVDNRCMSEGGYYEAVNKIKIASKYESESQGG
jgi:hypothetical protein